MTKNLYRIQIKQSKKEIEGTERIITNLTDFLLKEGYSRKQIDKIIEKKNGTTRSK